MTDDGSSPGTVRHCEREEESKQGEEREDGGGEVFRVLDLCYVPGLKMYAVANLLPTTLARCLTAAAAAALRAAALSATSCSAIGRGR